MSERRPIKKLLIANRGEIAVRIARTCRAMGIETVAVYSEADRRAMHVRVADEGVHIGPPEARNSYLDAAKIIGAARTAGADAIHPGYGFLSENGDFAQAVVDAGLIWVGPHPSAIREMGSKVHARRTAERLGVPVVPGYDGDDQTDESMLREAKAVGYPLMIKASAGGGGKGIRIVNDPAQFEHAMRQARQEALAAFGDDRLIIERYIRQPRHVEVQVLGDKHGHVVHLFTRDCSVQRRHQKLIEEAPAPNLSDAVREAMHAAALKFAGAIDYDNAGTIEFLYESATESFFFLEMNTRLQVEHPVTEEITGVDLVELQLLSAMGDVLPVSNEDLRMNGVAIEARVCAEAPHNGFRPASGTVVDFDFHRSRVRIDSGVENGDEVSPYYDPMIAKIVAHGETREAALDKLTHSLRTQRMAGVETNMQYAAAILSSPAFRRGDLSTHFLETHLLNWAPDPLDTGLFARVAAAIYIDHLELTRALSPDATPWETLGAWRFLDQAGAAGQTRLVFGFGDDRHEVLASGGARNVRVVLGDTSTSIRILARPASTDRGMTTYGLEIDGVQRAYSASISDDHILLAQGADWVRFRIVPKTEQYVSEAHQHSGSLNDIVAPYPGSIREVAVSAGDRVTSGDNLVVMEAMKMIQYLVAPADGIVKAVHCVANQSVDSGQLLVEFERIEAEG